MTLNSEAGRLRHRADSSYSCGEETRSRLIDVAIRLFGERGYEGASTRDIARQAGVNTPAVQYYFDNKEGLYRACTEHLVATADAYFSPTLDEAETILQNEQASREELIEAFSRMQETIADYLLRDEKAQQRGLFRAQEQAGRGCISNDQQNLGAQRLTRVGAALVARLSGLSAEDPLTLLRLITANGQLMVFHIVPRATLGAIGWEGMNEDNLSLLKKVVREQTRALIDSWHS
jgi:AcrR family transcriptional regulator